MFDMWIDIIFMGAHTQCRINLCTVGNTCSEMFNDRESYSEQSGDY